MRLLLDTAVVIFALEAPERLSKRSAAALANPENVLELSAISIVEIALKFARGKLNLSGDLLQEGIEDLGIGMLPYTSRHAFELFSLPLHHRDPFDRQMIAQALVEGIAIVTLDDKFSLYEGLKVIW